MDVSCHRPFLPGISIQPTVIPTAQDSSFWLQTNFGEVTCCLPGCVVLISVLTGRSVSDCLSACLPYCTKSVPPFSNPAISIPFLYLHPLAAILKFWCLNKCLFKKGLFIKLFFLSNF
jgi:hypothetical protein